MQEYRRREIELTQKSLELKEIERIKQLQEEHLLNEMKRKRGTQDTQERQVSKKKKKASKNDGKGGGKGSKKQEKRSKNNQDDLDGKGLGEAPGSWSRDYPLETQGAATRTQSDACNHESSGQGRVGSTSARSTMRQYPSEPGLGPNLMLDTFDA